MTYEMWEINDRNAIIRRMYETILSDVFYSAIVQVSVSSVANLYTSHKLHIRKRVQ